MMIVTMALADNKQFEDRLEKTRRAAEERDAERRAVAAGVSYIDLRPTPVEIEALGLISEDVSRKNNFVGVNLHNKKLLIATYDPTNATLKETVEKLQKDGYASVVFVCSKSSLQIAWSSYKYVPKLGVDITGEVSISKENMERLQAQFNSLGDVQKFISSFHSSVTTEIIEVVLAGALSIGASDIHMEPSQTVARLRYRVDGELNDIAELKAESYKSISSRIKLLSNLKLNVKNEPQDGRFSIKTHEKDIQIRVSTVPSEHGEIIVLRLLDPDSINVQLGDLGFRKEDLDIVMQTLKKPNGMILNTGPTGSGKTTTLYAFVQYLHKPEIKIITIEDPIEYHVPGISQTQVKREIKQTAEGTIVSGYTFANGLRSILRQDPDVILVGEIRDLETAKTAMNASLTGHVVFSTLHANQAAGAIPRFIDMGVKPQIIAPALSLIIAQRLVRKLCATCKQPKEITEEIRAGIEEFLSSLPARIKKPQMDKLTLFEASASGCEKCHKGYRGRIGIFELLVMSKEIEELMHNEVGATVNSVKKLAVDNGMITMQQDGVLKALIGTTSLTEVERISGPVAFSK